MQVRGRAWSGASRQRRRNCMFWEGIVMGRRLTRVSPGQHLACRMEWTASRSGRRRHGRADDLRWVERAAAGGVPSSAPLPSGCFLQDQRPLPTIHRRRAPPTCEMGGSPVASRRAPETEEQTRAAAWIWMGMGMGMGTWVVERTGTASGTAYPAPPRVSQTRQPGVLSVSAAAVSRAGVCRCATAHGAGSDWLADALALDEA